VAAIHSQLLRTTTVKDLAEMFPERFNNKTNGVTPRRWLLLANPALAGTITDAIGDGWITDLSQLTKLKSLAEDKGFRDSFRTASRDTKARFANWLGAKSGATVDPDTIFDCQIKRIHEYKRQLLNALRIVALYNRLRENPGQDLAPRTFFFAGKAAPAYHLAKLIINFINNLAPTIDGDPAMQGRLKVLFLPEYNVSLAERLIPASDVSNQISTAGFEASGTSNMKFMMNGALTIATRDGATIEMAQEAGEENFFLFGLTAQQVADSRSWYNPHWHYENEPETRAALDLIFSNHFSRHESGIFDPLRDMLLTHGDYYRHLADLKSYLESDRKLVELSARPEEWARKSILNVAEAQENSPATAPSRSTQERSGTRSPVRLSSSDCQFSEVPTMEISPLAGKPVDRSILIDVANLVAAYYNRTARSGGACAARGVWDLRASRLLYRRLVQRGAHSCNNPGDLSLPQTAKYRPSALHRFRYARAIRTCASRVR
jgi:starch phosphorylase